jgi:hypothetical protein
MLALYIIKNAASSVNYSHGPQAIKQFIDLAPVRRLSIVIIPFSLCSSGASSCPEQRSQQRNSRCVSN